MAKTMNLEEALAWVANIFEAPEESITPETKREDIESWDSLGSLTLLAALDEDFDITVSDDVLAEMQAVDDVLKVLRTHGCLK
jgi:acyl carrier protein